MKSGRIPRTNSVSSGSFLNPGNLILPQISFLFSNFAVIKLICGAPMNEATNKVWGLL